jgi:fructokinase
MTQLYGGIEAGGTKFVCMVAAGPGDIRAEVRFPTTTPDETLSKCIAFFKEQETLLGQAVVAIGVACFGPIDPNPASPTFGYITTTPKPGWAHVDVVGPLHKALGVPIAFDHDVVVAGVGEGQWGAAQGLSDFIYFTIGTGIGGGVISHSKPVYGLVHPEIGHIRLPHDFARDPFVGNCIYHNDCFEGMAAGPAIEKRWGQKAYTLGVDHPAWDLEAEYIALALNNIICTLSPQRIILGGGVMDQTHLFPMIREKVVKLLNGYIASDSILEHIDQYIVPPGLGNQAGALGCIAIAQKKAAEAA